ncbi:MAG: isoleucine--tRNA ligase [Bryobacteraceae bacterium]
MPYDDLKKTVHLPRTGFPMKANLGTLEPKLLAQWTESNLYQRIRADRKGRPTYILHDGPPYANGEIHLGTAFNKILKDFVVKLKTMEGFDAPYVPGWDCHGLPIENKIDNELGSKKASMTQGQIRAACRKYAQKYVDLQRRDFIRLGVLGRWEDPYLTMSAEYEAVIAQAFIDFLDQGFVYKGLKPVNWCIHDRTALAEAEVEYADHSSPSIWVRFPLMSDPVHIDPSLAGKRVFGLIWTTTPWTIPANLAIAYHPKFTYSAIENNGDVYIVAEDLVNATAEVCDWQQPLVLATFSGEKLNRTVFRHPFLDRDSIGILGEHVTLEQGTGAVHTAPGHGADDYVVGRANGLPVYCPVDAAGRYYQAEGADGELPPELLGKTVWEGNSIVIEILKSVGALAATRVISHSYPHCWRCHNPTIFRATEQWFVGMDNNNLRANALAVVKNVHWTPSSGEERMHNMIATRPDWCISRQRVWGVPITVFYCEACSEPLTDRRILNRVVELFREHTADIWYSKTAAELIGEDIVCKNCNCASFRKESDILDVWFDSGASHLAVLTPENDLPWPSDLYLEGGDQYRGWFQSSLLVAVALKGASPYRASATAGWTLDSDGHAMHKSKGNAVEPEIFIKQHGADLLRLWTASVDFTEDVRLSQTIIDRLVEAYRKLRNTFKYALGNLEDFDPLVDAVPPSEMLELDRWILARGEELVRKCRASYSALEFHKVYRAVYDFAAADLSSVYFEILRDRLYTSATKSHARRSGQSAVYKIHYALTRLLAPLLSFTAEEVWSYTARPIGAPDSVHLAHLPEPEELAGGLDAAKLEKWDQLMAVRDRVLKMLETARQDKFIGAPLEAKLTLKREPILEEYFADLPSLFVVSAVEFGVCDRVEKATGAKCERCWKYTADDGAQVCAACRIALTEMGITENPE